MTIDQIKKHLINSGFDQTSKNQFDKDAIRLNITEYIDHAYYLRVRIYTKDGGHLLDFAHPITGTEIFKNIQT